MNGGAPQRYNGEPVTLEDTAVAPTRGVYRLGLATDDGSRLWLDSKLVADNDGLHGASEVWFDVPLDAGLHHLRLDYFQHLGGRDLYLKWVGRGFHCRWCRRGHVRPRVPTAAT